jgi:hypothetical protein
MISVLRMTSPDMNGSELLFLNMKSSELSIKVYRTIHYEKVKRT